MENKTVFNYEIKEHGDKKEEYHSNCIMTTKLLWRKCSKTLKARTEVEIKGSFTTTMDTVTLLKWIEDFSLTCTEIQYNMSMVSKALLSLLTCRHGDHEDLCESTER